MKWTQFMELFFLRNKSVENGVGDRKVKKIGHIYKVPFLFCK